MRRWRAVLGMLTTALCAFLGLAVVTDSAVPQPGPRNPAATAPYAEAPAAPALPVAATRFGSSNAEQERHPVPYDDCRHRRAIRASVAVPVPQSSLCAASAAAVPAADPARTSRSVRGHAAVAAAPDPGERPALLQVFRC